MPEEILIGDPQYTPRFSGSKRRLVEKWDSYQYIPLLTSLKALLCDSSIQEQIQQLPNRFHKDGRIEDFCDGTRFNRHPLFSQNPNALQIVAHYDELEVCNPLGSHVKSNKVGVVSYTLGNIHPKYRSKLRLTQLAIIATIPVIEKHGLHSILKPLIHDLNILANVGIEVSIDGINQTIKGALLVFLADNLASNDLGGFKKSFSFAFCCYRTCLVTENSLSLYFNSEAYHLRNTAAHEKHLKRVSEDVAGHFSKIYGINERTSLMDVKYFSIFEYGLPHDMMHDLLEGLVPHEIKLLLLYYTSNHYFTLREFNERLINFNFGYSEKDKPLPILSTILKSDKKIRASASQMLLLVRTIPFLIGDKISENEDHWVCFMLLRKILDVILSPIITENFCSSLKLLIIEHHSNFVHLYGASLYIPKLHFLTHYPEQMLTVGPMLNTWTMRYEAKLRFYKQAAQLSNFKNIAYSLANRHQRWMCYEIASGNLISDQLECGPFISTGLVQDECENFREMLQLVVPQIDPEVTICRPKWVKLGGILYKPNDAYVVLESDGLDPVFGLIIDILVLSNCLVVFHVMKYRTLYFSEHYHAYAVQATCEQLLYDKLFCHEVYHAHRVVEGVHYICLKYSLLC